MTSPPRFVLFLLATLGGFLAFSPPPVQALDLRNEYIIISGGPSLRYWENYRREPERHDQWWGNFIRSARVRIEDLQKKVSPDLNITWLVYKPGYMRRQQEDSQPLIENIESVRDKYGIRLVWFYKGDDVIHYINQGQNRNRVKVTGLEYFGHSNKFCFVFDYSNEVLGASKSYLHERDLSKLEKRAFAPETYAKSWGCHTGESFSSAFRRATGIPMVGAIGKTNYSEIWKGNLPFLSSPGGSWSQ